MLKSVAFRGETFHTAMILNGLLRLNALLTIDWKRTVKLELDPHTSQVILVG